MQSTNDSTNSSEAEAPAKKADLKPGLRTTEFWLTVISTIAGLALTALAVLAPSSNVDPNLVLIGGLALLGIPQSAYAMSRGAAKRT